MISVLEYTRESIDEGALAELIPEFYDQRQAVENSAWHDHDNVYNHVLSVFEALKGLLSLQEFRPEIQSLIEQILAQKVSNQTQKELLAWAGLLHDIAKPDVIQTDEQGQTKCPDHEQLGAKKAQTILQRIKEALNFSSEDIVYVTDLVAHHDDLHQIVDALRNNPEALASLKAYKGQNEERFWPLLFLSLADTRGSQLAQNDPVEFEYRTSIFLSILHSAPEWERV